MAHPGWDMSTAQRHMYHEGASGHLTTALDAQGTRSGGGVGLHLTGYSWPRPSGFFARMADDRSQCAACTFRASRCGKSSRVRISAGGQTAACAQTACLLYSVREV